MSVKRFILILFALTALTALSLYVLGATYSQDIKIPPVHKGRHINIDDIPIRYVQEGEGPDVLLIHGSLGSIEDWETLMPELSRHFRVTAFDRLGHGYSAMPETDFTLQDNAHLALGVIRKLGLTDTRVLGHSYGGAVALQLAADDPPEVASYVLLAPLGFAHAQPDPLDRVIALPILGLGVLRVLAPNATQGMLIGGLKNAVSPNEAKLPGNFYEQRLKLWNRPAPLHAWARQRVTVNDSLTALSQRYASIRKPVVILQGDKDAYRHIQEDSARLAERIPDARLIPVKDAGHYIQYAAPQAVIEALQGLGDTPSTDREHLANRPEHVHHEPQSSP